MKHDPFLSVVRNSTMSAGTRWFWKQITQFLILIFSYFLSKYSRKYFENVSIEPKFRHEPGNKNTPITQTDQNSNNNLTFSTYIKSPTRIDALSTWTTPLLVNLEYFCEFISRSLLIRRISSTASRIIVTQSTNPWGDKKKTCDNKTKQLITLKIKITGGLFSNGSNEVQWKFD